MILQYIGIMPKICLIFASTSTGFQSIYNQEKTKPAVKRGRKATGLIGVQGVRPYRENRIVFDLILSPEGGKMKRSIVFLILVFALFFSTVSHARLMKTTFSGTFGWTGYPSSVPPTWVLDTGILGTTFSGIIIYDDSAYPTKYEYYYENFVLALYPIVKFEVSWGGNTYQWGGGYLDIWNDMHPHCQIGMELTIDEFPEQYQNSIVGCTFYNNESGIAWVQLPELPLTLNELFPDGLRPNSFGIDIPEIHSYDSSLDWHLWRDLIGATDSETSPYCGLNSKFAETTLSNGMRYYTDRAYTLTSVPSAYIGMDTILTPNDDLTRTAASDYLTFEMPYDGTVYVAYDSRATSLPNWLSGFSDTGDRIYTSLSTQPYLKIYKRSYFTGDCINLGANKAPGFSGGTVSNYMVLYGGDVGSASCLLASKFVETTLSNGMRYYTDRAYTLTSVPSAYIGMDTILTPNDDLTRTAASDYLTFEMPYDGTVYVAYDSRATSLPNWLSGFSDTGDRIYTSLSTQPYLKIYKRSYFTGDCINLGANKAPGFSGGTVSNYMVLYGGDVGPAACTLASKFVETTLSNGMRYYTDRAYTLTSVPSAYIGMDTILTPNDDLTRTAASDYLTFEMPYDGTVYVAYDSRATSLPNWLSGFSDTGDRIYTSLSTQPYLKIYKRSYFTGDCINLGANKAPGFSGGTVSNYMVLYGGDVGPAACTLASKFVETTLSNGMEYYTDRDYTLTGMDNFGGQDTILTPNDERNRTAASDYLTFEMPYDGTVYVAYDSRATSLPYWLRDFYNTNFNLYTSLSTQPSLNTYGKTYYAGDCVNLGANKAPGFSGGTVSNYMVFFKKAID
jgi:hypothetical protein